MITDLERAMRPSTPVPPEPGASEKEWACFCTECESLYSLAADAWTFCAKECRHRRWWLSAIKGFWVSFRFRRMSRDMRSMAARWRRLDKGAPI